MAITLCPQCADGNDQTIRPAKVKNGKKFVRGLCGNDFWVWRAIDCVAPAIVICEFNAVLGDRRPVVVPYDPAFTRFKYHYSGLYLGCSILALQRLADQKGYAFVGTSSNGVNAFFVRKDLAGPLMPLIGAPRAFP